MSDDKYRGEIGPANAMSALDPAFHSAYSEATSKLMDAVIEFELATGRIVDSIALDRIDVTTCSSIGKEFIRQPSLGFLPKPNEVDW